MKRSQASTTPTPSSPAHKKVKMSPNPFEVLAGDTEDGWTKVEKRKTKKARKLEAKIDVCVSCLFSLHSRRKLTDRHPWWKRANPPGSCTTAQRSSSALTQLASMCASWPHASSLHEILAAHLFDRISAIWSYTWLPTHPRPVG